VGHGTNGPIVLVIDDEPAIRDLFARVLAYGGLFPVLADNAETALLLIQRGLKPHAILLDIGLPGMNGYEVAKTLREEGFANAVIVAVSGYGQPEDRERSREAGVDDHLVKPIHREMLVSVLRRCAEKQAVAT